MRRLGYGGPPASQFAHVRAEGSVRFTAASSTRGGCCSLRSRRLYRQPTFLLNRGLLSRGTGTTRERTGLHSGDCWSGAPPPAMGVPTPPSLWGHAGCRWGHRGRRRRRVPLVWGLQMGRLPPGPRGGSSSLWLLVPHDRSLRICPNVKLVRPSVGTAICRSRGFSVAGHVQSGLAACNST